MPPKNGGKRRTSSKVVEAGETSEPQAVKAAQPTMKYKKRRMSLRLKKNIVEKLETLPDNEMVVEDQTMQMKQSEGGGLTRYWEQQADEEGFDFVIGVDEAGRGPLAGPVVAAACYIPSKTSISDVNDSKKLSKKVRETIFQEIMEHSESEKQPRQRETDTEINEALYSIVEVDHHEIDRINILQATMEAMTSAVEQVLEKLLTILQKDGKQNKRKSKQHHFVEKPKKVKILIDGNRIPSRLGGVFKVDLEVVPQCVVKGDSKVFSIACASVLAKVHRDHIMQEYHHQFPIYGFDANKGYPTAKHREALLLHGPCEIHRRSYAPVKRAIEKQNPKKHSTVSSLSTRKARKRTRRRV